MAYTVRADNGHPAFVLLVVVRCPFTVRRAANGATLGLPGTNPGHAHAIVVPVARVLDDGAVDPCVFCSIPSTRTVAESDLTLTIRDAYPVSPGHMLIIAKRHVADFFEATAEEVASLMTALRDAKVDLEESLSPDGFNVGINCGTAAGQTVPHLHIHLIPRFHGDTTDPRGGVRHCIPGKGLYPTAGERQ